MLDLVASLPRVQVYNICLKTKNFTDPEMKAWDRLINRLETNLKKAEEKVKSRLDSALKVITKVREMAGELDRDSERIMDETVDQFRSLPNKLPLMAVLIADEGKHTQITKLLRKMTVINHIPSMYNTWPTGARTKNIVAQRIIEDPVFKDSKRSFFIQLADCVAFSLLKKETIPTPNIERYDIQNMFEKHLGQVCVKAASGYDNLGIVRE